MSGSKQLFAAFAAIAVSTAVWAQVTPPFASTRIVNGHSTETLGKGELDFRISHRFGDVAGDLGGSETFFGIDNARDIRLGLEYGVSDDLMIGVARKKGISPTGSKAEAFVKYALVRPDSNEGFQWWATAIASSNMALRESNPNVFRPDHYSQFAHRLTYMTKLAVAARLHPRLYVHLAPYWLHRNFVFASDENDLIAVDVAARIRISKVFALLLEATWIDTDRLFAPGAIPTLPLSAGIEIDTGGHVFQLDVTNASGLGENQYAAYTTGDWAEGQFRLGFTISRPFKVR